jgi:hypothetical protein
MTHRRLVWPLLLTVVTGASVAAHLAAHSLFAVERTGPHAHHAVAAAPMHWRTCLTVCAGILLAALAGFALASARRGRAVTPPLWLAALLPPAGFVVADGLGTRGLVVGALLQLALAALLLRFAHALAHGAASLGRALRARPRPRLAADLFARPATGPVEPGPRPRSLSVRTRGPPRLLPA